MKPVTTVVKADVLVIGGGLAGTWAGLEAKRQLGDEGQVVVADKSYISRSGQSPFAAGIYAVFDPAEDDLDVWVREMVELGEYLNDQDWCRKLWLDGLPLVQEMMEYGRRWGKNVFDLNPDGSFVRRRSRGHIHTKHNVVNSIPMMDVMRRLLTVNRVQKIERVMVTDLVLKDGEVIGALGIDYWNQATYLFLARSIVLAASGAGFKSVFMGHRNLTGDLQAAAFEAGIHLRNMEQYSSNTTARDLDIHGLNLYVGVGGRFLNARGEEFMWEYNPTLGSRARLQDLVLAFCREAAEGRGPVRLDMSAASPEDRALCRKILPETFLLWDRAGIDPFEQPVEWIPAFYGTLISGGGVHVDTRSATNLPRVYAGGDLTCEPPHGTYSFGGVNIAFAAVSGWEAGRNAARDAAELRGTDLQTWEAEAGRQVEALLDRRLAPLKRVHGLSPDDAITAVQQAIIPWRRGYLKSTEGLEESWNAIKQIEAETLPALRAADQHELMKANEVRSLVTVAKTMIASARARTESRGWHFREEYPRTDNVNWLKWVMVRSGPDGEPETFPREVPLPYVRPTEDFSIPPGVRRTAVSAMPERSQA